MRTPSGPSRLFLLIWLVATATFARAQDSEGSGTAKVATPMWRDSVRYAGGPSVGPPPSDYDGTVPPAAWCLQTSARATGDFGMSGQSWNAATWSWLRQVLSDSSELGAGWRAVLGGAPRIEGRDSIVQVLDDSLCHDIAAILNRDLLGWKVGPPPVVVLRIQDYLIAFPSNARIGEFGYAVGMGPKQEIRGVATW